MVDDQYSGQAGHCVTCGREITVPEFRSATGRRGLRGFRVARWMVAAAVAVGVVASVAFFTIRYGSQGMQTLQSNRLRGQCMQNLEEIAQAMNAYARDYGSYPPPVTVAADGTPLHSWRVLILPYLGYQTLYDEFELDEPWDSLANQNLVLQMPREYQSPTAAGSGGYETYYALVTGPGTLFPATGPLGPSGVTDDPAKTLLVLEAATPLSTTLQWTEPGDLDVTSMSPVVGVDLGGHHRGGATAVTVDGRGQFLHDGLDAAVVRALLTPRGGEGLPDDVLD